MKTNFQAFKSSEIGYWSWKSPDFWSFLSLKINLACDALKHAD